MNYTNEHVSESKLTELELKLIIKQSVFDMFDGDKRTIENCLNVINKYNVKTRAFCEMICKYVFLTEATNIMRHYLNEAPENSKANSFEFETLLNMNGLILLINDTININELIQSVVYNTNKYKHTNIIKQPMLNNINETEKTLKITNEILKPFNEKRMSLFK